MEPPGRSAEQSAPPSLDTEGKFDLAWLDYELPEDLIAQHPAARREDSRLLVVDRGSGTCTDCRIHDLPSLLSPGDLLVLNDTKVIPARFFLRRASGGLIAGLFIEEDESGQWRAMLKRSRRLKVGERLQLVAPDAGAAGSTAAEAGPWLRMVSALPDGHRLLAVEPPAPAESLLARYGRTPLPPYIRRGGAEPDFEAEDRPRYQTVYARVPGAVAAPTAGLHLTPGLLVELQRRGVGHAFVTLHVGLGTFKPIAAERLNEHVMHSERFVLPSETRDAVAACRARGGRVVAVGTTSVRVLESCASADRCVEAGAGSTDIFIYPPYRFRVVDALLTNFHLPRSTLLALVMALAGEGVIQRAYAHAIRERYRFFSFGDAMFITPPGSP